MTNSNNTIAVNDIIKHLESIRFVKNKFDIFSSMGLLAIIATFYYLIFDREEFLFNMSQWYNLFIWILMITYPILRYFLTFHIFELNKTGITTRHHGLIKWSDIDNVSSYDNYEEEKNEETPVYRHEVTVSLSNNKKVKLKLSNYTIEDKKLLAQIKPFLSKNFKMKDVIIECFINIYTKNKTKHNSVFKT